MLSASMSNSYQETFDKAREILKDLGYENVNLGDEAERAAQMQENAWQLASAAIIESGALELLGKIKDAYEEVITPAMEFEYTMSAVGAISEASVTDMEQLTEKAEELGRTTVFTAQESGQAMIYMAQAGWDTIEMLEGMDGVIALAAASGTDLSEVSSITADTLAGFGMAADETARLADVLAQTASHTNTNVSLMGETFANSAAIAGALGFEIEDVSVMLGLMANAGVKGSKAGTTLRNIFNGLAKDATLTSEAFGEVEFSMFDENGNAKGLVTVVRELREYFSQMTEQERYLNASSIAGLRGYNGLLAILNATDDQFEELYDDISNAAGAAEKMAKIRLDNLKGDVTLLKSAAEGLEDAFGGALTGKLRPVVQLGTRIVQWMADVIDLHPGVVAAITGITGAIAGAAGIVGVVAGFFALVKAFQLIGLTLAGPVGIVALIAGLATGLTTAILLWPDYESAATKAADAHRQFARELSETEAIWKENALAAEAEADNTLRLEQRLEELIEVQDKTEAQKREILGIVELLNEAVPDLALAYDAETDSLNRTTEAIKQQIRAELERDELEEKYAEMKRRMKNQAEIERQYEAAYSDYEAAQTVYDEAKAAQDEVMEKYASSMFYDFGGFKRGKAASDLSNAKKDLDAAQLAYDMIRGTKQKNDALVDILGAEIADIENRITNGYDYGSAEAEQAAVQEAEKEFEEARIVNTTYDEKLLNFIPDMPDYPDVPEKPEGAEPQGGGDNNITMTVNINGDVTKDTVPDVERIVEEAADKVITFITKKGRERTRLAFN